MWIAQRKAFSSYRNRLGHRVIICIITHHHAWTSKGPSLAALAERLWDTKEERTDIHEGLFPTFQGGGSIESSRFYSATTDAVRGELT